MADDYISMINRIGDEVQDGAIVSNFKNAIQDAIKLYRGTRFYFNQKTAPFNTVANQEYYAAADLADIPTLIEIDDAVITTNGVKVPMGKETFDNIDYWQSGASISLPRWLAYFGQQIRLYPIPDAVYPITMSYFYRLSTLSADGDTNAWMTDAEILIRQCAKRLLAVDVIQEAGIAAGAGPLEQQALDALLAETRRRRSVDRLRTDVPLSSKQARFNIFIGDTV